VIIINEIEKNKELDVAKSAKYLLIGSTEAYSGKSATVLGLAHQLREKGIAVDYRKPVGTYLSRNSEENEVEDLSFFADAFGKSKTQIKSSLLYLNREIINRRLGGENQTDYTQELEQYVRQTEDDLILLEGPANLWEGSLFNLSAREISQLIGASILLVVRYHPQLLVDSLLTVKQFLGDRLLGVVINDIPSKHWENTQQLVKPFLEAQNIPVLGLLPRNNLLRSVSVRELTRRLDAKVLCRPDRLDLMVESLTIGAMNVNSALEYFRQGRNKVVVTGGDRTDLQLAALETSTHCLILTGHSPPQPMILNRAEDLEIPILSVNLDTLTTVEIVDEAFGKVPILEPIKIRCIQELMKENFDLERLMKKLGIEPAIAA
jgi:hypothetical protein